MTFLGILWDAMVEKMRVQETEDRPRVTVLTGKRIVAVDQGPSHVHVVCADGSSYDGDVVVGADCVRSVVRRLAVTGQPPIIQTSLQTANTPYATPTTPTSTTASILKPAVDTDAVGPFRTRYVALFGMSPMPSRFVSADRTSSSLRAGTLIDASAMGRAVQILTYEPLGAQLWWAVYRRIVEPGQRGRRAYAPGSSLDERAAAEGASGGGVGGGSRYSEEDVRAFAAREADEVVIRTAAPADRGSGRKHTLTVGELFATSLPGRCGMTDLEEGVVPPGQRCVDDLLPAEEAAAVRQSQIGQEYGWAWSRGRAVCVGDAVHKSTPNLGVGCNMAVEGVVVLMNHLRPLLLEAAAAGAGKGHTLTASRLDAVFCEYAAAQYPRARRWVGLSGWYARSTALETWSAWLMLRWLLLWILSPAYLARKFYAPLSRDAPVLDWLDEPGFVEGPMGWTYRAASTGKGMASEGRDEKGGKGTKDGRVLGSVALAWVCELVQRLVNIIWDRSMETMVFAPAPGS